ncbi:synaptotagmin-5 isoform X2 [Venturia canescens]|uniref:synaptotagmin-5 isoform X2 n=1 Tax=Venturia canescens TaxID=32260 RepID=UPI001C9D3322|nr:synaptotagmin-5 isoform X2 [Venturia canescens]XP_043288401.1 synaptotagmin-5 isoform X2 [Venturia canescens]XP_043288410.1 synaptotagmin-5 isoform X2 [Venturia canescens]
MVTGVAIIRGRWAQRTARSPLSSVTTTDSTDSTTSSEQEFNALAREQHLAVQPSSAIETTIVGESADSDYGIGTTLAQPRMTMASGIVHSVSGCRPFVRNSSISSQGSLEGGGSSSSGAQRGSCSPRIRAFGPDGRHRQPDSFPTASSYPPSRSSRSPSPARAISLDARSASPASFAGSCGTASPSQNSLSSLTTGGASSSCGSSSIGAARSVARCLSPLLIPPPSSLTSDSTGPAPPASPLGSLQPDLYQRRDGPLFLSAQSTTAGKNMGRLHLRLKYDFDRSDLRVHLIEAHDLAGSDQGGFNDPYVKLTLSPEVDTRKRQTPIHRNNPNPFFDQHFKFPVSHEQLQEKTLVLQVFDYDRFSRNDVVGSVRVAMEQLEFVSSTSSIEVWGEIAREKKPPEEIQQVLLSLSYLPSAERLTVLILKARNLFPSQEDKEIVDPFVKVSLLTGDKRVKKKKTAVRKATRCPVWNEAMSFNVSAGLLASSAIEVCVLDSSSELIGGNAILGSCIVGPATGGTAVETEAGASNQSREHWLHMTHSPRKAIAMWHTLH